MNKVGIIAFFLMNSLTANAEKNCGRFSYPIKSILKESIEVQFDFTKVAPLRFLEKSHCFYYSEGVRCDVTYDHERYFFFFNQKFSKTDVDSGASENYFMQWLKANDGKKATLSTYNTLFEWNNDYEDSECTNWYERSTHNLTIDGHESVILE